MPTEPFNAMPPAAPHADQQSISAQRLARARELHRRPPAPLATVAANGAGEEAPRIITIAEEDGGAGTKLKYAALPGLKGYALIAESAAGSLGVTFIPADV